MLTVKTYRDGDRLVVVFEGLSSIPDEEAMIKSFLGGMIDGTLTKVPDVEAKPVPANEDVPEIPKEETPMEDTRHEYDDGPYKGMTPPEALSKDKARAIGYLVSTINGTVRQEDANLAIKDFLRQFSGCDAKGYSEKLSSNQVFSFIRQYSPVFPVYIGKTLDIHKLPDEKTLRGLIEEAITAFKKLS